jgi:hypothetical protein
MVEKNVQNWFNSRKVYKSFKQTECKYSIQKQMGFFLYCILFIGVRARVMVLNATFNNISVISWKSVLLVEETRVPRENHWPATSHWPTLSNNVVSSTPKVLKTCYYDLIMICFFFVIFLYILLNKFHITNIRWYTNTVILLITPRSRDTTLCDKFVSDLREIGGFLRVLRFPPPIKLTTTIWLKYCWKWH